MTGETATAKQREANAQRTQDTNTLNHILNTILALKDDHPCRKAIGEIAITNITELTSLSEADIRGLHCPDAQGNLGPVPVHAAGLFLTLRRPTHFCASNGKTLDWNTITRDGFRDFQVSTLNPDDPRPPLVPTELAGITVDSTHQATPPPPPASSAPTTDAVRDFRRGIKRDQTLFPVLNRDQGWHKFHQDFLIEAKAQGVEDILNPKHKPSNANDKQLFLEKQKFMTAVLKRTFMTNKGKSIITQCAATSDAQKMFAEAEEHCTKGAHAEADSEALLNYLITSRLNDGLWKGSAADYSLHWEKQVTLHNDKSQHKIVESHQRQHLQNAVAGIPELATVKNTAAAIAKTTKQAITFDTHLELLTTAAQQCDINIAKIHPTNKRRPRRDAHQAEPVDSDDDCNIHFHDACDHHDFDTSIYDINAGQQNTPNRRPNRPRLHKDVWRSLSYDDRRAWDQLSDAGKLSVIQHPNQSPNANSSPARPTRSIKASDIDTFVSVYRALAVGSDDDNTTIQDDDDQQDDNQEQEDLHAMLTKNKSPKPNPDSKLPGNINRLLTPEPKTKTDKLVKG